MGNYIEINSRAMRFVEKEEDFYCIKCGARGVLCICGDDFYSGTLYVCIACEHSFYANIVGYSTPSNYTAPIIAAIRQALEKNI